MRGSLTGAFVLAFGLGASVSADDLKALQGTWEARGSQNGRPIRIVKTIAGNRETVRTFEGEILVREHVVEFELKADGEVRIFRWKNGQVTAGPWKGKPLADGAVIYRLEGDQWITVSGMLRGDREPVSVHVFRHKDAGENRT